MTITAIWTYSMRRASGAAPARRRIRVCADRLVRGAHAGGLLLRLVISMIIGLGGCWAAPPVAAAYDPATPDVAVIVDTSKSMRRPGMDPERSSLLVSKLLADILPGNLSVIRLLDRGDDAELLPRIRTGERGACKEDSSEPCWTVEPTTDWGELAREGRYGVLRRVRRGDAAFKQQLDEHLAQTRGDSLFYLSFRAAEGVFAANAAAGEASENRTIIWLSDGKDEAEGKLLQVVEDLRDGGVRIDTILFGRGDPTIPERLDLEPVQVDSPLALMGAFAQAFRRIMRAPYRIDHLVAEQPSFDVRANVDTVWVVVYGDPSLDQVTLYDADGRAYPADFAADRWDTAGAYRVARVERPPAGTWRVETDGGGPDAAYAVVQRSSLRPLFIGPERVQANVETRLLAGIAAGNDSTPVADPEVTADATLRITIDDTALQLRDDGTGGDEVAGDGRFTTLYRFTESGPQELTLELQSPLARAKTEATVEVEGVFRYGGADVALRFDLLRVSDEPPPRCVAVPLAGLEHRGTVPVELVRDGPLPAGHRLFLHIGGERLDAGAGPGDWPQGAGLEACLEVRRSAPDWRAAGTPVLSLRRAGSTDPAERLRLLPHWQVQGLGFWERWGWLILSLLAVLTTLLVALGYILPVRFQATLAIAFGPERDDVDEYPPQPVRNWRGVGIGFYRNARAFLQRDFRLSGRAHGALAVLFADGPATRVQGRGGFTLFREDSLGDWVQLPQDGELARPGEVYRIGEAGPYFRLSAR